MELRGPVTGQTLRLRDDPARYTSWYGALPRVAALDPRQRPLRFGREDGYHAELFADGSKRIRLTLAEAALALLHELLHADTHRRGGGANVRADEWRSYEAFEREATARNLALGAALR